MSSFNIPGLGFAKPNEVLPLAPDTTPSLSSAPIENSGPSEQDSKLEQLTATNTESQIHQNVESKDRDVAMSEATGEVEAVTQKKETTPSPINTDITSSSHDEQKVDADMKDDQAVGETSGNGVSVTSSDPMKVDEGPANGASITDDLEAAIGGLGPFQTAAPEEQQVNSEGQPQEETGGEHPEWEVDSSPYESSSESDSSDSSSDEDSDNEQFKGLSIEETARLLMEADAGSDDEERGDKNPRAQVRTKNELPEEVLPKPDVTITPEMKIEELGAIEHIVDTTLVIKAYTPGEYQVIDTGSVLCTADRVVIGALADILGKVQEPLYTVRFNTPEEIAEAGLKVGTKVFYSVNHANYVFTQALKNLKGSDASNLHDEEIAEDEAEFSDDEKEAEYKRKLKQKRRERQGGDSRGRGGQRGPHPLRNEVPNDGSSGALNYDDAGDDDGPYKPLTRPPGYGASGFGGPTEEAPPGAYRPRGGRGGPSRGRGQQRGRGFGRGRGGSGNGVGGSRDGYSLPPQNQQSYSHHQPPGSSQPGGFNFQVPGTQHPGQAGATPAASYQAPTWPQPFPNPPFPNAQFPPVNWAGQQPPAGLPQNGPPGPPLLNPALLALLSSMTAQNQGQQHTQQHPSWQGPPPGQGGQ
ncbi:hypothetical protein jhhlp_005962 [Lomentospora prolificans]|uniref:H/ACA ribonucleoprotein complex non-core subunit NAF1 n=1 Tax=Lomentospora prolificans TaxID=41688 RepID=A0A2N3N4J7_9PEZI|nr:hypothetical protein jhhlp_005962 [Lomentospora prolificans]